MKLSNLRNSIDPVILDRGRDYKLGGYVLEVEEVGDLVFRAEIRGSEIYEVYVELGEDGTVLSSDCNCPYDYGPIFKHQAAVLLKLCDGTTGLPKFKKRVSYHESIQRFEETTRSREQRKPC